MKNRVFGFLMSALFLAPTLLSAQTQITENTFSRLRLSTRIEAPVLENVQVEGLSFTTVSVAGFGQSSSVGQPALPFKVEMMEVPQGAMPSLVVDEVESYVIDLAAAGFPHRIIPAQAPRSKNPSYNINKFFFDEAAYAAYRAPESPVALSDEATLRDLRIAYLHITPVIYHPESHTLQVFTRIDYHVDFEGADLAATSEFKAKYASVAYGSFERALLNPLRGRMPAAKSAVYTQRPVYVIVSHPMFREGLQKFIDWKTMMGFRVVEAYTDEVGSKDTKIRAYLKKLYDEATPENPAPSYVLFVGDVAQVPSRGGYSDPYWYEPHVSDLYFCEYTGDRLPDVLYGRMSASTVEDLMPQIDKLMYMENIPYEETAFLDNSFLVAGIDADYGRSHLNPTIKYLNTYYYKDTASRHCDAYFYPNSGSASSKIVGHINAGVSVGIYTAHGDWNKWTDPEVNNTDVSRFTNKDKYPLLIGNCCLTGKFNNDGKKDTSCFAETLLRKKEAGAVAYIGASNSSYFDEDVYWAIGYTTDTLLASTRHTYASTGMGANDAFFHTHGEPYSQWALSVAEIMQTGNMAVERSSTEAKMKAYYWQIYHVFGDPSYRPYNHRPVAISAEYPRWFRPGELQAFEVSTWPYAWVSLSCNGEGVAFAMADENGKAVLDVSGVDEACMLSLCISAQNGLPVMDKIEVSQNMANEEGGASPQTSSLRISVVRAHGDELVLSLSSPQGEVSGELRLLSATGSTLAVLDRALRVGVEAEQHTYKVADLPSGLYLCTFTPSTARPTGCKFVIR